jgi:hypothetical protein
MNKRSMTLSEIISNIDKQNEEAIIFAKRKDGKFIPSSEAVLVELSDEEQGSRTNDIAEKHCPGFDYFLEVFLVRDMVEDLKNTVGYKSSEQQIGRIIHYAEFDA